MPVFRWKGRGPDGRDAEGETESSSQEQAVAWLRAQGIVPRSISASYVQEETTPAAGPSPRALRRILIAGFLMAALLILAFPFLSVIF